MLLGEPVVLEVFETVKVSTLCSERIGSEVMGLFKPPGLLAAWSLRMEVETQSGRPPEDR